MQTLRKIPTISLFLVFLTLPIFLASKAIAAKNTNPINQTSIGIAVKGYDMVTYFINGEPSKGNKEITHEWRGSTWRFANAENHALFVADPEKYAPQYGGYCAYGVSQGATVSFDPNAWTIVDDKLYLNLSKKIQKKWEKDIPGYIESADNKWPGILAGKSSPRI